MRLFQVAYGVCWCNNRCRHRLRRVSLFRRFLVSRGMCPGRGVMPLWLLALCRDFYFSPSVRLFPYRCFLPLVSEPRSTLHLLRVQLKRSVVRVFECSLFITTRFYHTFDLGGMFLWRPLPAPSLPKFLIIACAALPFVSAALSLAQQPSTPE